MKELRYAMTEGGLLWTKRRMAFKNRLCLYSITCINDGVITSSQGKGGKSFDVGEDPEIETSKHQNIGSKHQSKKTVPEVDCIQTSDMLLSASTGPVCHCTSYMRILDTA